MAFSVTFYLTIKTISTDAESGCALLFVRLLPALNQGKQRLGAEANNPPTQQGGESLVEISAFINQN